MLGPIDTPSLLISLSGLAWTLAYVAYIRQAHRDRTVGMPLPSLLLNITWEALYGLFLPSDLLGRVVMLSWLAIDCVLVRCALVYDRVAYGQPVRGHFGSLLSAGTAIALLANALFPHYFWTTIECTIAHGMLLQVGLHAYLLPEARSILTRTSAGPPLVVVRPTHSIQRFDTRALAHHLGSPLHRLAACLFACVSVPSRFPKVPSECAREGSDAPLPRWRLHVSCHPLVGARYVGPTAISDPMTL